MKIEIDINTNKLPGHTADQLKEWVEYKIGAIHNMDCDNPLGDIEIHDCFLDYKIVRL
jgi:hypothetical protein